MHCGHDFMETPLSSSPDRLREESHSGAFRGNDAKMPRFLRLQTVAIALLW